MPRPVLPLVALHLLAAVCAGQSAAPSPAQAEFFEKSVRPVLAENCISCHGPEKQKAGLRLDSRTALLAGGKTGPVMVPGKPEQSLLLTALHYEGQPRMPPRGKLQESEIRAVTAWIKEGAPWPEGTARLRTVPMAPGMVVTAHDREFWSFRPPAASPLPVVQNCAWPQQPLDYFILASQEAHGLHPSAPADKRTLLRRATFDLIGLPPTPGEVEAFLADSSEDAYRKVVDRLLASPHYGERWARHWLDVARYGEDQAHTFQARKYPEGFRYRDWLIRAFNEDLPYDQFIREQLAADLLAEPNRLDRLPALGFLSLGPVYYGDPKKLDQMDDRIDTVTRGFLGLTVACARCHDHKFDPIPTRDYYALAGVFASTEYMEVPLVPPQAVEEARKRLTEDEKKKNVQPRFPFIHGLADQPKPVRMRVHIRGNPETLGDEVGHHFLTVLGGRPFAQGSGRLELAEAIAASDNPLTARVLVNRIWQQHFGRGLVRTASNFGQLGEPPSHPALLDDLAVRFMAQGWSIKALHREILLSATYQQSSRFDAQNAALDAENTYLWRMNRRRLEVEAWRDAMLAVAGNLEEKVGGPSFDLAGAEHRRRTCYAMVSRHELNPLLRLFDFPDPNITSSGRTTTTVPLQQLFVLNSEFMIRNARALAARLTNQPDSDPEHQIVHAYLLLYGRPPSADEIQLGVSFLSGPDAFGPSKGPGPLTRWQQYAQALLGANEFLYVD